MITLPLSRAAFWSILPIAEMTLSLPGTTKSPRTRGGELLPAEYGTRLWQGEVQIAALTPDEYRRVAPLLHLLDAAGSSFFMDDRTRRGPWSDPNGSILAGASVQIEALINARDLALRGLPAGYVISTGDRLSWSVSGVVSFHEVVVGATANANGVTGAVEVVPPIRPGVAAGQGVVLFQPFLRAQLVPGSYEPPSRRGGAALYQGGSFTWRQSLRG